MDISVIICTYNRGEYLRKVLFDLIRQETVSDVSFEVIIVDNNSMDNTKQVCEEFIVRCPEVFRYVFEERQGKTFALNMGIRESRGNVIAFTDDDVVIDERWVISIKQAFKANPDCMAFGGRVVTIWPDTLPPWIAREGAFRNTDGAIVEHDFGGFVKSYPLNRLFPPIGANMFFARGIFEKYGGFNEKLNQGMKKIPMLEDTEFCDRLMKNKENILYIPDSVVYHPVYQNRLTRDYFRKHAFKSGRAQYVISEQQRSGKYVILNLRKNSRIILNIPLYLCRDIVVNFFKYVVAICKKKPQEIMYFEKAIIYNTGIIYETFKGQWKLNMLLNMPNTVRPKI